MPEFDDTVQEIFIQIRRSKNNNNMLGVGYGVDGMPRGCAINHQRTILSKVNWHMSGLLFLPPPSHTLDESGWFALAFFSIPVCAIRQRHWFSSCTAFLGPL